MKTHRSSDIHPTINGVSSPSTAGSQGIQRTYFIRILVFITIVIIVSSVILINQKPQTSSHYLSDSIKGRIVKDSGDNWTISIVTGSAVSSSIVTLRIFDPLTGQYVVNDKLNANGGNTTDFQFVDRDNDHRVEVGDMIYLKGTENGIGNPRVRSGSSVFLLINREVTWGPAEIPP